MIQDRSSFKPWAKITGPGIYSIDIEILPGTILGLIGPNGAGKTTLLRVISGIYNPDGQISMDDETRRETIGYMPEQVRWEGRMTVHECLKTISTMNEGADVWPLIRKVGLANKSETKLDELSQGMRQRLSLACALLGKPKILVMDEPLNGLDPLAQRAFCNLLKDLAAKGVAIVISSHQVAELSELVDRVALLHHGQILTEGTIANIENALDLEPGSSMVDMICAATGIDPEDISLDLSNDSMLPFKRLRGEEE
jgi:ABC-type multidrug transport system ATPase subunit